MEMIYEFVGIPDEVSEKNFKILSKVSAHMIT